MPDTSFESRQLVVKQPYQGGSTSQGAAASVPGNLGSNDKRENQPPSETVVGTPHVDALPETEEGHGQAVHQDSAVEVEAGSTKGQHRKETERKQPDPRELEQEGDNNPSGVRHQREPEKDTRPFGDPHLEGRDEASPLC